MALSCKLASRPLLDQNRHCFCACPIAPRSAFSKTVSSIARAEIWKVRPRPIRARVATLSPVTSRSINSTRPESGAKAPLICAIKVDLPAPFGPMMAWISPAWRSIDTLSVAFRAPKDLVKDVARSKASDMRTRLPGQNPRHPAPRKKDNAK